MEIATSPVQANQHIETGSLNNLPLQSVTMRHNTRVELTNPAQDLLRRVRSANLEKHVKNRTDVSPSVNNGGLSSPNSRSDGEGNSYGWDGSSRGSPQSPGNLVSSFSDLALAPCLGTETSENGLDSKEDLHHSSPPSVLVCTKLCWDIHVYVMEHVHVLNCDFESNRIILPFYLVNRKHLDQNM